MRIKLLLFWIILGAAMGSARAQMFQNRNLYDVWITAEGYLNAGKFDKAITLYEGVPNVPQFQNRLKIAKNLLSLYGNAEYLYQLRKYDRALELFSKYREMESGLHLAAFDDRIQTCLRQLDKINVRKLNESTRIVAGFEWAYKGDRQLSVLDTAAAGKSYAKAAQLGGNLNATLREQYKEGLRSVEDLKAWGQEYRNALETNDNGRVLDLLKGYRSASKYIISSLEHEIKSKEEQQDAPGRGDENMADKIKGYARDCRVDGLLYYLRDKPGTKAMSKMIDEYMRIQGDIAQLEKDPGNRTFLESAYRSLISKGSQIPEIGKEMEACARKSYYRYLINLALLSEKAGDESGERSKLEEAVRFVVEARQLGLVEYQGEIEEMQRRLAGKTGCEGTIRQFARAAISIRREISNCRIRQGKKIWEESLAKLSGCNLNTPGFLSSYVTLRDSINRFYKADSLYFLLEDRATSALASNLCEEAGRHYRQMAGIALCNTAYQDSSAAHNKLRMAECERTACFKSNREKAESSVGSKKWVEAYTYYERAYECATFAQRERVSHLLATIECDAYPERCRRNMILVEPTLRLLANKPRYTENGVDRPTSYGYFTSAGIQVSFLSAESFLDLLLGAEYFRTRYQSLRVSGGAEYKASEFDISGANTYVALKLHKPRTDPDRLQPYVKAGAEMLLPLLYTEINFEDIYKSTNDRSLIKKQLLMATGAIGIELERKGFGFFAEVTTAYNFSGIYNTNAVSSSGARRPTEAHFRAVGIRLGLRFW